MIFMGIHVLGILSLTSPPNKSYRDPRLQAAVQSVMQCDNMLYLTVFSLVSFFILSTWQDPPESKESGWHILSLHHAGGLLSALLIFQAAMYTWLPGSRFVMVQVISEMLGFVDASFVVFVASLWLFVDQDQILQIRLVRSILDAFWERVHRIREWYISVRQNMLKGAD